jgi:hypothetical protein
MIHFVTVGMEFTYPEVGPIIQDIKMQCKFTIDF